MSDLSPSKKVILAESGLIRVITTCVASHNFVDPACVSTSVDISIVPGTHEFAVSTVSSFSDKLPVIEGAEQFIPQVMMSWVLNSGTTTERQGQFFMNRLFLVNERLYKEITEEIDCDCFYDDRKIPAFVNYVYKNWYTPKSIVLKYLQKNVLPEELEKMSTGELFELVPKIQAQAPVHFADSKILSALREHLPK